MQVAKRLKQKRMLLAAAGVALVANLALFLSLPLMWQATAALILIGLLPGFFFVEWLLGAGESALPEPWERSLYAVGAGYGIASFTLLLLSYLPGPLEWWHTLLTFDLILIVLLVVLLRRRPADSGQASVAPDQDPATWPDLFAQSNRGWLLVGLLTLALVGGLLRFSDLAYSEFQGDESRAALRAAEVIQGYSDALLSHKKGPAEILVPTGIYSLVDRLNEAMARLPFALANLAALFAVFLLGWRLFHPLAGWSAAMLLALDGYFIGFARIVQYQSIVFLTVVLVVLVLYRLVRQPQALSRYLTLAAIFLATGLLAHYEAALVVLPAAYLVYALWRRGAGLAKLARALVAPVVVGTVMLASFYIPFILNPSFGITYAYITVNRIGTTFPYNNLVDVFERTTLYSSIYYLLLLIGCAVISLAMIYKRNLRGLAAWIAIALLCAGVAVSFWQPTWLTVAGHDQTWLFFAAAIAAAWLMPDFTVEERTVWIWFGVPLVFMLFFTLTPNTHVYGFFIPWTLIAGMVLACGWQRLRQRHGVRVARLIAVPVAVFLIALFGNYEYWYFAATDLEVLRTWRENRPGGYYVTYDMPTRMSIFGFPLKNGWKAVGALYADGILDAPFDLHGKEPVADWYTRGTGQCPRDHVYYLWHESVEPADLGYNTVVRQQIEEQGYQSFGVVEVNGQPRLRIYKLSDTPVAEQLFSVEDYEERFDYELSGPIFTKNGPNASPEIEHPLDLRFGDSIWLKGYSLDKNEAEAGAGLQLTLFWQATQPVPEAYSIFTQVIDMTDYHKAGQRDGEPVCNQLPTDYWRPGDVIVDRYYIPLFSDAPPGTYSLLIGMYGTSTGERLDIFDPNGQPVGDAFGLTDVTVRPASKRTSMSGQVALSQAR